MIRFCVFRMSTTPCNTSLGVDVPSHGVDLANLTTGSASEASFRCSKPVFRQTYHATDFLFLGEAFAFSSDITKGSVMIGMSQGTSQWKSSPGLSLDWHRPVQRCGGWAMSLHIDVAQLAWASYAWKAPSQSALGNLTWMLPGTT